MMTQNASWHAGHELLDAYAQGTLGRAGQAAVETHLTDCADCRVEANRLVADDALEPVWTGITTAISAPSLPLPLRVLGRLGARYTDLVVLRAASAIYVPWALAVAGALIFVAIAGSLSTIDQRVFYAAIAPLLPVVLVGAAYDSSDPARELLTATPFSKLRIALLRTALAVTTALPVVVVMGLLVPELAGQRAAWLLPSLSLTIIALVLLTWLTATVTVGALATCWIAVVAAWATRASLDTVTSIGVQSAFLGLALVATAALAWLLTDARLTTIRPGDHS